MDIVTLCHDCRNDSGYDQLEEKKYKDVSLTYDAVNGEDIN
jgi:hypothetical protein